jgi:hypothetical protein
LNTLAIIQEQRREGIFQKRGELGLGRSTDRFDNNKKIWYNLKKRFFSDRPQTQKENCQMGNGEGSDRNGERMMWDRSADPHHNFIQFNRNFLTISLNPLAFFIL